MKEEPKSKMTLWIFLMCKNTLTNHEKELNPCPSDSYTPTHDFDLQVTHFFIVIERKIKSKDKSIYPKIKLVNIVETMIYL